MVKYVVGIPVSGASNSVDSYFVIVYDLTLRRVCGCGPPPTYRAEWHSPWPTTGSEVSLFVLTIHVEYGRPFYKLGIVLETAARRSRNSPSQANAVILRMRTISFRLLHPKILATPLPGTQRLHFCPYYWLASTLLAVCDLELESTYSRRRDSL